MKCLVSILLIMLVACGGEGEKTSGSKETRTGAPGKDGKDGSSCSVESVVGGASISCDDGSAVSIRNGIDGIDGINGLDGKDAIVMTIDPCGPDGDKPQEVILVLSDGTYLAWYKNIGLYLLEYDSTYQTTDAQKCTFSIDENGTYSEE